MQELLALGQDITGHGFKGLVQGYHFVVEVLGLGTHLEEFTDGLDESLVVQVADAFNVLVVAGDPGFDLVGDLGEGESFSWMSTV